MLLPEDISDKCHWKLHGYVLGSHSTPQVCLSFCQLTQEIVQDTAS